MARLLVHRMWHPRRSGHVLLHLWAGYGAGPAIELLPFCVAHVWWPAGDIRYAASVLLLLLRWSWA